MVTRVWKVLPLALATTGCSFFMNTAPSDPSERTVTAAMECTNSSYLPIGDSFAAAVSGINIAIASAANEGDELLYYGGTINKKAGV
ncbi:MAG TPA: hypothetical protein VNN72_14050, partial [Polyangiaceae bacterium]|nr:hypothetical protein [Polyangiaceae bacterium]